MMQGINVFAVEKVTVIDFSWLAVFMSFFLAGIVSLIIAVKYGRPVAASKKRLILTTVVIWLIVSVFLGLITGILFGLETENRYIVTIDDTVPYVEFTNRYDVLEHTGSLYTIRDKVNET